MTRLAGGLENQRRTDLPLLLNGWALQRADLKRERRRAFSSAQSIFPNLKSSKGTRKSFPFHLKTGALIVYTSADSVFQIAANEAIVPVEKLYEICAEARRMLVGKYGVGRVIARPFVGDCAANFTRTPRRHDFSLVPPADTMLDVLQQAGKSTIGVGKIHDIFAGKGVSETIRTSGNTEGLKVTMELADRNFDGLAFVNLVDFDMLYGHRRDVAGYAAAAANH